MRIPQIKIIVLNLVALYVLSGAFQRIHATHIVGGELIYKHVEGDTYQITLTVRRDCFLGAPDAEFDNPARLAIYTNEGIIASWLGKFGFIEIPFIADDTLNTTIRSDCGFLGPQVCIHETKYVANVTLPYRPTGYYITYQRCCRNMTVNNIVDPLNTGGTYSIRITGPALLAKNSSPEFKQWNDIYICVNEALTFDHSATDVDGDQLVYRLITPYSGASEEFPKPGEQTPAAPYEEIIWQAPYSKENMMGGVPLMVNPNSGLITATPNLIGQFVIGISVEEYRNGQLYSVVRRDFQYNVRECTELPVLDFVVEEPICNFTATFNNLSTGVDIFFWNFDYPNENPDLMSAEVSPTIHFPAPGTYTVHLRASRSQDGCTDELFREIFVHDSDLMADFELETVECGDGFFSVELIDKSFDVNGFNELTEWHWVLTTAQESFTLNSQNVNVQLMGSDLQVSLEVTNQIGCKALIEKEFNLAENIPVASFITELKECTENGQFIISFTNTSENTSNTTQFLWSFNINNQEMQFSGPDQELIFNTDDHVIATLTLDNGDECIDEASTEFHVSDLIPSASFGIKVSQCNEDGTVNVQLANTSDDLGKISSIEWTVTVDGSVQTYSTDTVTLEGLGSTSVLEVTLRVTYSTNCESEVTQVYEVSDLIPMAEFEAEVSSCNADGTIDILLTNRSTQVEDIESVSWTVSVNGMSEEYSGNEVLLTGLSTDAEVEVSLLVTYNNGCNSTAEGNFRAGDLIPQADYAVEVGMCNEDGTVTLNLVDQSDAQDKIVSRVWRVELEGEETEYTGSVVVLENIPSMGTLRVRLEIEYNNGCRSEKEEEFEISDILPMGGFEVELTSCNEDGTYTLTVRDVSGMDAEKMSILWEVEINGEEAEYSGSEFELVVEGTDVVVIVQRVGFENGCMDEKTETIEVSDLIPSASFEVSIIQCNEDGTVDIQLVNTSDDPDLIETIEWNVTINGSTVTHQSDSVTFTNVNPDASIDVELEVTYTTGCLAVSERSFDVSDIIPTADYEVELLSCNSENDLNIRINSTSSEGVVSYLWEVISGDQMFISLESFIHATINRDEVTIVRLDVAFENGCTDTKLDTLDILLLLPQASYAVNTEECPTLGTATITLTENTVTEIEKTAFEWSVISGADVFASNESDITFTVSKDDTLIVTLKVTLENGCVLLVLDDAFVPGPYPSLEFSGEPITGCPGDTILLLNNFNPDWTYTFDPVEGIIPGDDLNAGPRVVVEGDRTYFVTVSDGICSDSSTIQVVIDSSAIIILSGDEISCDGNIEITASTLSGGGIFEWSTNRNFSPILFAGDTLRRVQSARNQKYFVRISEGECAESMDSITVIFAEIDIFQIPFQICRGDTAQINVVNLDPSQQLMFTFQPDPHIVRGGESGMPVLGIGEDEEDSFTLYYSVVNQFGCTNVDSVIVEIVPNPAIDFEATLLECGAFTVCFRITTDYNGLPVWNFGDPDSGSDNMAFDEEVCHTYPGPGSYDIQLRTISNFCPADPLIKTIILTESFTVNPIENVNACMGDSITLTSGATVDGLNYVWCTVEGDTLGVGETITIVAMLGGADVLLKGFDFFNCSDTTLFRINVFDFNLDFEIPDFACNGDPTMLRVFNLNGGNLNYMWGPSNVVVAGGMTDSPTIIINEATEIIFVAVDPLTGCSFDTSFIINHSSINATISADPSANIRRGESTTLIVETDGVNVMYEWSDPTLSGAVNTVMPLEDVTYTVTVTDENGCSAVATIVLTVMQPECDADHIFLPNAFTPNGDGVNDVLFVRSVFVEEMTLTIYNRWGQEVFRSNDINVGWDGTFRGQPLTSDSYAYYLQATCPNQEVFTKKGNVSLIR